MSEESVGPYDLKNYRWPAEWEPHAATWIAWPVNEATWPGRFDDIPLAFANFVATVARFEPVNIIATPETQSTAKPLVDAACELAAAPFAVRFIDIPVNDSWCRDYGPLFLNRRPDVFEGPAQIILDWQYNAWGGKYPPWDLDANATQRIAEQLSLSVIRPNVILEGGAIDGNGQGVILTTESCLLNPNRNPELDKIQVESVLRDQLQIESIVWLSGRGVVGDDTDGHIDQLARFGESDSILAAAPFDDDAPEAGNLRANLETLSEVPGQKAILELQMPNPKFQQDHRLPSSYCNFYIVNSGVIVPTFRDVADEAALQVIQSAFPLRKVVGVDALDLAWGLGAFHCLTQQQPSV